MRLIEEKRKFKEKENDNKMKIKQLVSKIENEKDKRLFELTNYTELKKKVLYLQFKIGILESWAKKKNKWVDIWK